ncbi:MAG: methionyl-tRNA formyltransferase [Candidatus Giovannonibacteria bacterium]|nr:MAG: methionyl-tRNA formyltransferase [Candidatus Giovannonibacteria bacterium]
MKITIFTSNQARHISLIEDLSKIAEEVYAVIESFTVFTGEVADFYNKTEIMQKYFKSAVIEPERQIFGAPRFLPKNVRVLSIKAGDLSMLNMETLSDALKSDKYIVFGSSYIKGPLVEFLVKNRTYNIHIGTSPYYRGNSCNFWAAYHGNFDYVGATIHLLSRGLDSGDMLFHAFPEPIGDPLLLGMRAVKAAHKGLIENIKNGKIDKMTPVPQDKSLQIKYTRGADFTDEVARDYLDNLPAPETVLGKLKNRDFSKFLNPYIG